MTQRTVLDSGTMVGSPVDPTGFDRATAVTTAGDGRFDVDLDAGWAALVGIHGGYLVAIATVVAEHVAPRRAVRTVSTTFFRPARPGPAVARARTERDGRSLNTVVVDIEQGGRTVTSSRFTLVRPVAGLEWGRPVSIELPPPDTCSRIQERSQSPHFDRVDGRLDPASLPFDHLDGAMVQGYVRPIEPRPIDAAWLAMATDWFPPPAFVRVDPPLGGISVDLTTHVHRTIEHDQDEWLVGRFEIEQSAGGLAVEHGVICTLDGTLLAESFQTRWTAAS